VKSELQRERKGGEAKNLFESKKKKGGRSRRKGRQGRNGFQQKRGRFPRFFSHRKNKLLFL